MRHSFTACAAAMVAVIASAAPQQRPLKAAWQWTDEERLTARFDAAQITDRTAAYVAAHPQLQTPGAHRLEASAAHDDRAIVHTIDGSRNPELLLRSELFDALMTALQPDAAMATKQRGFYGSAIRALGYEESEFWSRLESASDAYLPIRFSSADRALARDTATPADEKCRSRYAALQRAQRAFGRAAFDRVLYEAVAPTMQFSEATADPDPVQMHLRIERGCH